jgi:glutathione S-transferase
MFFEQSFHEPYVATARFIIKHLPLDSPRRAELPDRMIRGRAALSVMETRLSQHPFFVGETYTIADIALYAYTHVAHEAHFDMMPYPAVRAWIERVASEPRYVPLAQRPGAAGAAAA